LLPGLRSIISIPAGFAEMSVGKFALYSGAGGGLFAAGVAALVLAGADGRLSHAFVVFARPHFFAALALARSRPVLAVATVLLALFAALLARNAYVIRSNSW
jgi:membrane protein DedA with SNARE-associated domain